MSYSEQFDRAFAFASKLHRDQTRKGKDVPYINHLMGVASLVGTYGGDEEQVIAALLHDAVEDFIDEVPDIRAQILGAFGPRVASIVEGCTQSACDPKRSPTPTWGVYAFRIRRPSRCGGWPRTCGWWAPSATPLKPSTSARSSPATRSGSRPWARPSR